MNWLHCNRCFQRGAPEVTIHLTSCGHLFCEKCKVTGTKSSQCPICSQQCSCVAVAADSQYSVFFKNPADVLKSQQQQLMPILEFQRSQMTGLITHYQLEIKKTRQSLEKHKAMEREYIILKEENSLLRKENLYLKKKMPQTNAGSHHGLDSPSRLVGPFSPAKHLYGSPASNPRHQAAGSSPAQKYDRAYGRLKEKHTNLLKHLEQVNSEHQNLTTELNKSDDRLETIQEQLQVCERVVEEQCREIRQLHESKEQHVRTSCEAEAGYKQKVDNLTALCLEKDTEVERLRKELQLKEQELATNTLKRRVDVMKTPKGQRMHSLDSRRVDVMKTPKGNHGNRMHSLDSVSNVKMTPKRCMWRLPRAAGAMVTRQPDASQSSHTSTGSSSQPTVAIGTRQPDASQSSHTSTGCSSQPGVTDWLDTEN